MRIMPPLAALASLLIASTAAAQPGAASSPPSNTSAEPETAVSATIDEGVLEDPNSGGTWFAPTGLTMPKGSWGFHDNELFFVGMSYGVTDRLQLSATTLVPISSDQGLFVIASVKGQIIKQGRLRVAAQGAVTHVGVDDDSLNSVTAGAAASLCLDDGCHSLLTGYVGTGFALDAGQEEMPLLLAASITKRLSKRVKFVGEIDTGMLVSGERADAYLGWYGLRFHNSSMAANIGFVKPFGGDIGDTDVFPIGFPWVSFTYRGGL